MFFYDYSWLHSSKRYYIIRHSSNGALLVYYYETKRNQQEKSTRIKCNLPILHGNNTTEQGHLRIQQQQYPQQPQQPQQPRSRIYHGTDEDDDFSFVVVVVVGDWSGLTTPSGDHSHQHPSCVAVLET